MWQLKKAFITGSTSGLGLEVAMQLMQKGCQLFLTGRDKKILQNLQDKYPNKIEIFPCDLTIEGQREKLLKKVKQFHPDLVINNAGFGLYGNPLGLPIEKLIDMVQTNCTSLMEISLELAKTMPENSVIVHVSSVAGSMPMSGMSVYGATKAFVTSFSKALRIELEDKKIDVLTFAPGRINTDFGRRASMGKPRPKLQNNFSMTTQFAASTLIKQIEKRKAFCFPRFQDRISTIFGNLTLVQRKMKRFLND